MTSLAPKPLESIRSFIVRLSSANDYDSVKRLFTEHKGDKNICIESSDASLLDFVKKLVDIEDVSVFSPIHIAETKSQSNRIGVKPMMDTHPHVCPSCLAEKSLTNTQWQLYPITHCPKHNLKLMTHCCCGEKFKWDQELLEYGCSNCFASWAEIAHQQEQQVAPDHVLHFYRLNGQAQADFLEDLLTACMRALRPYDSVHHGIKQLPKCNVDWTKLSTQAYDMLTDRNVIEDWCHSMAHVRSDYEVFGSNAVFYPLITLQQKLHLNWLVNAIKPSLCNVSPLTNFLPSHQFTSCNARNNSVTDLSMKAADISLIHQLDQHGFSQMTGCSLELTRRIFKIPSISSLAPVGRGRFSFIDTTDFIKQSVKINSENIANTTPLTSPTDLMKTFTMTTDDFIMQIYLYELPIHINSAAETLVEAISINEKVIANHLETTYLKNEHSISLTRAKNILCIPRNQVLMLAKQGVLVELPSTKNKHMIAGASIAQFLANYTCIERWSALNNASRGKVLSSLHQAGFKADIPPFIFKKTQGLQDFLMAKVYTTWDKQEQLELVL
ncbi:MULTISPECIES: TniQ family protein [Colwelliaceae]|nr:MULTISPECIES: TniQ family protein [Colwelliaceae]